MWALAGLNYLMFFFKMIEVKFIKKLRFITSDLNNAVYI